MNYYIFLILILVPTFYWLETYSWVLKYRASENGVGYAVALTNKLLYFSRGFIVLTSVLLSSFFETGGSIEVALLLLTLGVFLSASSIFFLYLEVSRKEAFRKEDKIFVAWVSLTVLIFLCALSMPWIFLEYLWDYRMTTSYGVQFLNMFATIALLFYVDPVLFKEIDSGNKSKRLVSYVFGRFLGMLIGSFILGFYYWFVLL